MQAEIDRALRLAVSQPEEALALFTTCADAWPPRFAELCRFERARVLGSMGKTDAARSAFARLAVHSRGEVRRQATLALCELDRTADPCRAAACLGRIAADARADADLKLEAARLREKWRLADAACEERP
jgi:hypothetical protein